MTINRTSTTHDSCQASVAILAALGLDASEVVSATIQMDGDGCTLTVQTVDFADDIGERVADAVQHFVILPHPPAGPYT